jgi:hypothetical protein
VTIRQIIDPNQKPSDIKDIYEKPEKDEGEGG